jgi:triosephosphate isomerase (TIM)
MHVSPAAAVPLVRSMRDPLNRLRRVETVLCPAFPALVTVADLLRPSRIAVGAQNCHWEDKGAHTGEVSVGMLVGHCRYVIVGHSERRAHYGDGEQQVRRKLEAILRANLIPILCVGEDLTHFETGMTTEVVARQVVTALDGLPFDADRLVIAYEPVWAIGSGKACDPGTAGAVIGRVIRGVLGELAGDDAASRVRVLYGGSVTDVNAAEYFGQPDIDGALVGGAALKAATFVGIARAAHESVPAAAGAMLLRREY